MPHVGDSDISDLTIGGAHGTGAEIGAEGAFLPDMFTPWDLRGWLATSVTNHNWELRKAVIWACYSGNTPKRNEYSNMNFPKACGIPDQQVAENSYGPKNVGLFFLAKVPQNGFKKNPAITTGQVGEFLDDMWVCGANNYPGACDPTYAFGFAYNAAYFTYPEMKVGVPKLYGYPYVPYTPNLDSELVNLNPVHVKVR